MKMLNGPLNAAWFARWCGAAVVGAGAVVFLSWLSGKRGYAAFIFEYAPMEPGVSVLFMLLGLAVCLLQAASPTRAKQAFCLTVGCLALAASLLFAARHAFGVDPGAVFGADSRAGWEDGGRMPLLTALGFTGAALAVILQSPPLGNRWAASQAAAALSFVCLAAGAVVILSYMAGMPLLYGGDNIPRAFVTASLFVLLSGALVVGSSRKTWPVSIFADDRGIGAKYPSESLLFIFVALFAGIGLVSVHYLHRQILESLANVHRELNDIADLKVSQILNWYRERQGDARIIANTPFLQAQALQVLSGAATAAQEKELREWMRGLQEVYGYAEVSIEKRFPAGLRLGEPLVEDLRFVPARDKPGVSVIRLFLWIAIPAASARDSRLAGAWRLGVDPATFLYPLMRSWPTVRPTAETLIVRREGDEVVYLNEPRYHAGGPLKLRLPIGTPGLTEAWAATGKATTDCGVDYRGVHVVAATRNLPGTPWFLVAKIDQDDVYASSRGSMRRTSLIILLLVMSAGLGTSALQRHRDAQWLRRDIDQRKELEGELRRLNASLEDQVLERTAALRKTVGELEHFSYSITHDMRSPLRAMRSYAELLLAGAGEGLDAARKGYLDRIVLSAERMDRLIGDALDYNKALREEWPSGPVDLDPLLRGMLGTYPGFQPPHMDIEIDGPLPWVLGNAAGLTQAISNLLDNAAKYAKPGQLPRVRVWAEARGEFVRLWIQDWGRGIPAEYHERIFDMFQRVDGASGGTGIGLALVDKVIGRMGGRVGVESELGHGSRFWLELRRVV